MLARKALAGTAAAPKVYVEDVFSTYLYTGNNSTQTITNNIDLSTEGGLVWTKPRSTADDHELIDSARGRTKALESNTTNAERTNSSSNGITAFNTTGYSLGANDISNLNESGQTFVSWTFRKAKKFFDVVTFTTNGTEPPNTGNISHNLGSTPGCVIVKKTSGSQDWKVYHIGLGGGGFNAIDRLLQLNDNTAAQTVTNWINVSSTTISFPSTALDTSSDYVAYLFAHDAGGFGDAGSDSIIKCGSYTGTTGVDTIDLGWEPQWLLIKRSSSTGPWWLVDNMRGMSWGSNTIALSANTSGAENTDAFPNVRVRPTPTGFQLPSDGSEWDGDGSTYIYIAIRRGPMKTPTSATTVFSPEKQNSSSPQRTLPDAGDLFVMFGDRSSPTTPAWLWADRLRGLSSTTGVTILNSSSTSAEETRTTSPYIYINTSNERRLTFVPSSNNMTYRFSRAPGFFDVVCYNGTGANRTVSHNLGAVPELIIVKARDDGTSAWRSYAAPLGATKYIDLNSNAAATTSNTPWNDTTPTSSVFTVGTSSRTNDSALKYVAYLFASLSGVSKVGTYTGNGSSVTVTTDFQPRFILVKRTDSTGDWLVSDSARGLVAGNDPYLELNTIDAEVTNEDWVDISSTSFTVNQTTNNANVNTGTYIYLAIA
jgi:hypothetical protein